MKRLRRIHVLLGVLFAPTILLFAITGAIQTAELQKKREGREPPKWMVHVVEVHKHQKWQPKARASQPAAAPGAAGASAPPAPPPREEPKRLGTILLKGFTVLMSVGLCATTGLGLWMAWLIPKDRKLMLALFAAGAVVPAAFLLF